MGKKILDKARQKKKYKNSLREKAQGETVEKARKMKQDKVYKK
jgi:hypothetical protein